MKYLNKIIFVNSANIPYAEVMLDGNVHFSGTQGVGKSTILRALLFFYNADKMHLGIQPGQKTFEEFYFNHSNSYILYEVRTGQSAYSIMLSRSHGRVVFRFIDTPFRKEWLVDEDGHVQSDWVRIRERIGGLVDISAKIDTYEQYRSIIYGNTHDRSHKYDKYAIVESPKFQNIPRSIQNVFLNSKLDADFVKNTIIQSMTEMEDSISLSTYRHLVADFEKEFDEIDCWYRKESNGEILVRTKAQKIVDTFRFMVALDYESRETWHQLNYVVGQAKDEIPLREDRICSLQESLKKVTEQLDGEQTSYEKEHDFLTKKIAEKDLRLKDIREKRKYYEELKISDIILLVGQESSYLQAKEQKEDLLRKLQAQYRDIAEKYKAVYSDLDTEWKTYEASQNEEKNSKNGELLNERDKLQSVRDVRKKTSEEEYKEWLMASDEHMNVLNEEFRRADRKLSEMRYWHPMSDVIKSYKESIESLRTQEKDLSGKLIVVRNTLASTRAESLRQIDQTEKDYARKMDAAEHELKRLQQQLEETEGLLAHWEGSLYEWLTHNKQGWEENIGKVVDERWVLYAQGLSPELTDNGSLFGVRLNLDAIPIHHRTPDEYRRIRKQQEESVSAKKRN